MRVNILPPAFVKKGGKQVPYMPSQEERESCHWAATSSAKCPGLIDCASCTYHSQNNPNFRYKPVSSEKVTERGREIDNEARGLPKDAHKRALKEEGD